ncbi:MAG: phage holin family protein [Myxococcota bacterium]
MLALLVHLATTAVLLLLVSRLVSGFQITGLGPAFIGAISLGIVNALVRPLMVLLTLPLTVLTLGLFLLVVNALMLWLASSFVSGIRVRDFGAAFWSSLVLSVLNLLVAWLFGQP